MSKQAEKLANDVMELEATLKMLEFDYKVLEEENKKLKKKLKKALMWAELRNNQTGKLINAIENITIRNLYYTPKAEN